MGGAVGGAVVRTLVSHQCVPGSIPGPALLRGFFSGFCGFPPSSKTKLNSNSIRNSRATGLSVEYGCVSPSLNKVDLFFLFNTNKELPQQSMPMSSRRLRNL